MSAFSEVANTVNSSMSAFAEAKPTAGLGGSGLGCRVWVNTPLKNPQLRSPSHSYKPFPLNPSPLNPSPLNPSPLNPKP